MNEWDISLFNQKLGNKVSFGIIQGRPFSGKTTIGNRLAQLNSMTIIDLKKISEKVKATLGTEDEPFEGEVPISKVEEEVAKFIAQQRETNPNSKFLFDGYTHKDAKSFFAFVDSIGIPDFVITLTASEESVCQRYSKANEDAEVGEEQKEEFKQQASADKKIKEAFR
jgi:shikimate kinase